jgi:hypothetical protein
MKLSISNSLWLLSILFSFSIMSCGDTGNSGEEQEISEVVEDTTYLNDNDDPGARRVRLSDRMRTIETELDREITELDRKIETGTEAEKIKWEIRREKLKMERDQLKSDLDKMGEEISSDWQKLEEDIADRLDRISEDLRDDN